MRNRKSILVSVVVVVSLCFLSGSALALTKGFEAVSLRPATDGGPYIGVWGSRNLDRFQWEAGTFLVYAYRPFQLVQNGDRTRGILDNTLVQHFYAQLGLIDQWLSIGLDLPVGWWAEFRDPNIEAATNQNKTVVGDIYVDIKSEFIKTPHFGLAILPFITIPTGYGKEFFGNGYVTGGGKAIAEVWPVKKWSISFNAGIQARQTFDFRNIEKSNQLELGLGTAVQLTRPVSIVAEIASNTKISDPFSAKVESPAEIRAAMKWAIGSTGLLANAGGTAGIVRGSGAPTYGLFVGLGFSPARSEHP